MPLNSHSYLVAQGWQGTGKALREGAVSRPVIIAQKKSLAGVGKDRDEAFPFWDHVFTAMATSINVKLSNDDEDEDTNTPQPSGSSTPLDRTSTGILSNRPQKAGLPALEAPAAPRTVRRSIIALAKRESARRGLYSRFFRGPVLGPCDEAEELLVLEVRERSSPSGAGLYETGGSISTSKKKGKKRKFQEGDGNTGVMQGKRKPGRENEAKIERKEKRGLKRSRKEAEEMKETWEVRAEGDVKTGLTKTSAEGSVQGGDHASYSRRKDRKKKKRKNKESITCHRG